MSKKLYRITLGGTIEFSRLVEAETPSKAIRLLERELDYVHDLSKFDVEFNYDRVVKLSDKDGGVSE